MKREEVIEEAAKAIRDVREVVVPRGDGYVSVTDADDATLARAAFAVFEKAHTPADDEREALEQAVLDGLNAHHAQSTMDPTLIEERVSDSVRDAGFRRSEVPEPSAREDEFTPGECDGSGKCPAEMHVHGCYMPHRADQCDSPDEYGHLPAETQGEPSSAQVDDAWWKAQEAGQLPRTPGPSIRQAFKAGYRAALRAAGGVR